MLLIPGPTPVADEVYDALASETWAHTDPRFVAIYKHSLALTREMLGCADGEVFVVAGSGTLAMEIAIVNTVAPGEKLLVISHGYFGDRFPTLARAFGIEVDVLQSEWGQAVDLAAVKAKLANGGYKAVTVTHVDTSTGVIADVSALLPLVKEAGALFILDGVCATAAVEEDMSRDYGHGHKIDVVLTGSQKAIGVPPGLAIVAFSPAALAARDAMARVPAYYADIKNWLPIMRDPSKYFATPAVNMIYAYDAAMKAVMAEGLSARYRRHAAYGKALRAGLAVYGMKALAAEPVAAPTLSCILYPAGVDDAAFRKSLAGKGMVIAGALASLTGKAFRIGHMGTTTPDMLAKAVRLIGETLREQGHQADVDRAVAAFNDTYRANA
jgi:aspartate aminotransferase-like enzyme